MRKSLAMAARIVEVTNPTARHQLGCPVTKKRALKGAGAGVLRP